MSEEGSGGKQVNRHRDVEPFVDHDLYVAEPQPFGDAWLIRWEPDLPTFRYEKVRHYPKLDDAIAEAEALNPPSVAAWCRDYAMARATHSPNRQSA